MGGYGLTNNSFHFGGSYHGSASYDPFYYAMAMGPPGEGLLRTAADFTPVLGSSLMINDGIHQGNWWLIGGGVFFLTLDIATLGTTSTLIKGGARYGLRTFTQKGITVLGHYPDYVNLASELNAKRFNIPVQVWEKMTDAERWSANKKFLDRMILRGDKIRLATPLNEVKPGSYFQKELNYLFDKGYKLSRDGQ